ncbi:MAG: DUF4363 family protein [Clostridiales bacterium]|nr:DUF4363 family protein [Clostridiales bacterium]
MNRLWIAIGLLAIVAGACIWGQVTVNNFSNDLIPLLQTLDEQAKDEDYTQAETTVQTVIETWSAYYPSLSAIKNHEELYELTVTINMLERYVEDQNAQALRDACYDCIIRIEHIKDGERPSWGNIF